MNIQILTLFPAMLDGPLTSSMMQRARNQGIATISAVNIRDHATDKHRVVDDRPFGGGPGMVMKPEPLVAAIEAARAAFPEPARVIYMTPEGRTFTQETARELAALPRLILVSGHYEGIDERVRQGWIDDEISIGDYVLTNGTLPALVVCDAVIRLLPGVLGNEESAHFESFGVEGGLEGPQYTRPAEFMGMSVPDVLLTGNHAEITAWRRGQGELRTRQRGRTSTPRTTPHPQHQQDRRI